MESVNVGVASDTSVDKLSLLQDHMQKVMLSQNRTSKRDFDTHGDKRQRNEHSTVKLPKLELRPFYGNNLH